MGKQSCYVWRRLASAKWEDAWAERLRFLGPNLASFRRAGSRFVCFEAWCDEAVARRLVREFGGAVRKAPSAPPPAQPPAKPIRIRDRFEIRDPAAHAPLPAPADRTVLWVPAGAAFGTGAHATTATLLRMLCDAPLPPGFRGFDAGTGTGILAVAMEKLGAGGVLAVDNDPAAVRAARANLRLNRCRRCVARKADALAAPEGCDVITANLFSALLIRAAQAYARALRPGGWFFFSGVLRTQWDEVRSAMEAAGLRITAVKHSGKWCAAAARPTGGNSATPARRRG